MTGSTFICLGAVLLLALPLLLLRTVIADGVRLGRKPVGATPARPAPLSEADVRRIVREEVAAIRSASARARGAATPE